MNSIKKVVLLGVAILFFSCGAGWSDIMVDLGKGYFYDGEGNPMNLISFGKHSKYGHTIEDIIVYPNVVSYSYDENFVLVKQNPSLKGYSLVLAGKISGIASAFRAVDRVSKVKISEAYLEMIRTHQEKGSFYRKLVSQTSGKNTIKDQAFFRRMADSVLKNDPNWTKYFEKKWNYYIIDKNKKEIYGPFAEQFFKLKKEN